VRGRSRAPFHFFVFVVYFGQNQGKSEETVMETIAAIATAQSPSAIGIVRLSGEETRRVLAALFTPASGMAVEALPYRRMTYGDIRSADGTLLDRGMAVFPPPTATRARRAPSSTAMARRSY
jgi:hypothetical protein